MAHASPLFMGMAVHKDSIAGAYGAQAHGAEITSLGTVGTRPCDLDHRIRKRPSNAKHRIVVDEAGPCGSYLYRYLPNQGDACGVVPPVLFPKQAGDRVNTDRRDAVQLARLARSGDLPAVSVPTVDDEAMRDLTRAREEASRDRPDAKIRLQALLLRQDSRSGGRATWDSPPPVARGGGLSHPAQHLGFQAGVRAVHEQSARLQHLEQARQDHGQAGRLNPMVEARQALRGVPCTMAVTMMSARGDRPRLVHE